MTVGIVELPIENPTIPTAIDESWIFHWKFNYPYSHGASLLDMWIYSWLYTTYNWG